MSLMLKKDAKTWKKIPNKVDQQTNAENKLVLYHRYRKANNKHASVTNQNADESRFTS